MNQVLPPEIEQALDLVLALPAHRSQNAQHAAFGQSLIQEYFVKLRERYVGDECAIGYLDNLFACVASAVRAFSVERDIFGTRWQSLTEQRNREIERANRLDRFSPFRENLLPFLEQTAEEYDQRTREREIRKLQKKPPIWGETSQYNCHINRRLQVSEQCVRVALILSFIDANEIALIIHNRSFKNDRF